MYVNDLIWQIIDDEKYKGLCSVLSERYHVMDAREYENRKMVTTKI